MVRLVSFAAVVGTLAATSATAAAAEDVVVFRVDATRPPGGDGLAWASAFSRLDDALAVAQSGSGPREIWVADGTYHPAVADRSAAFALRDDVRLLGGFGGFDSATYPGGETAADQRDPAANPTTLSGDLLGNDALLPGPERLDDNSFHVLTAIDTGATAELDGFIIEGGNAIDPGAVRYGGGLRMVESSAVVRHCWFRGNHAAWGGGLAIEGESTPRVEDCRFTGNSALEDGGAVSNGFAEPTVVRCTFEQNTAADDGGGFRNYNAAPTLVACTFLDNIAFGHGGGYYDGSPGDGAAALVNCLLAGNQAARGGAAAEVGGGGAIFTHCTIYGNQATTSASAVYCSGIPWLLRNCVVNANSGLSLFTTNVDVRFSCLGTNWPGVGNVQGNPLFVDAPGRDFRLRPGSPAIDAGDNNNVPPDVADLDGDGDSAEPLPLDLAGRPRFSNDPAEVATGPATGLTPVADMGAFERVAAEDCAGDVDATRAVDLDDLLLALATFDQPDFDSPGDADGDGLSDLDDLLLVLAHFGQGCD